MNQVQPIGNDGHAQAAVRKRKLSMKLILFVLGGALAGYLYYRFVGCRSGACPITSSPIISTVYGAMLGFLLSRA
jgi:F0F1-type ATP synthase assembly protein I